MLGVAGVEGRALPVLPHLAAPHGAEEKGNPPGALVWASSPSRALLWRRHPGWRISIFKLLANIVPPLVPALHQVVS